MTALLLPSRGYTSQPPAGSRLASIPGLRPIAAYNGAAGAIELVSGLPLTRGSAATSAPSKNGFGSKQTAVNSGLYLEGRPIPASLVGYTAVWTGEILGAFASSSPKLLGIANSNTSQSIDIIGVEFSSSTAFQVTFKTSTTNGTRTFSSSVPANGALTLVAVVDLMKQVCRLHVGFGGGVKTYVSSSFGSSVAPTITGSEVICFGPDVVEIPSRYINGVFSGGAIYAGVVGSPLEAEIAANPWQIFKTPAKYIDIQPRQFFSPAQSRRLTTSTGVVATVAPALLSRTTRTAQPQGAVGVDWGNPITRGLQVAALPVGNTLQNAVNGRLMVTSGSPTQAVTRDGAAFKTVLGSSQFGYFDVDISGGPATIFLRHTLDASSSQAVAALDTVSGTVRAVLFYGSTASSYSVNLFTNTSAGDAVLAAPTGVPTSVTMTLDAAQRGKVFVNGIAGTSTAGTWVPSGISRIHVSARVNTSAGAFASQRVNAALAWDRALSDTEIKSLSANPWQIFAPIQRNIWVPYP